MHAAGSLSSLAQARRWVFNWRMGKPTTLALVAALALVMLMAPPAAAQDYARGYLAFERRDYATALKELRPLAERGRGSAQYFLGEMYARGRGVKRDYAQAVKWFRAAAVQRVTYAQISLGLMYRRGKGVSQDNISAYMWYSLAARRGVKRGKNYLRRIATIMTEEEIREARWRAFRWRKKHNKY